MSARYASNRHWRFLHYVSALRVTRDPTHAMGWDDVKRATAALNIVKERSLAMITFTVALALAFIEAHRWLIVLGMPVLFIWMASRSFRRL